jgi:hypothetical protein
LVQPDSEGSTNSNISIRHIPTLLSIAFPPSPPLQSFDRLFHRMYASTYRYCALQLFSFFRAHDQFILNMKLILPVSNIDHQAGSICIHLWLIFISFAARVYPHSPAAKIYW